MKIAIAIPLPLAANGICRVVESWARILASAGHRTAVVFEAGEEGLELPACERIPYPATPAAAWIGKPLGRCREAVRALRELDERSGIDLIISHDTLLSSGIRRAFPRLPILQTIHSPRVDENRLNNWKYSRSLRGKAGYPGSLALAWSIERSALRSITCAHTLSEYTWERIRSLYPAISRGLRWQRIPGTFDDRRFTPPTDRGRVRQALGLDPDAQILLTVRRLVPRNGIDRILACAKRLGERAPGLRFLIGGTGELEAPLRREIERENLGRSVELLGFVPEQDLTAYYQAADAFLLPTRELECFGLPVIEAMACGCTPLVMPDGGPPELVTDPDCVAKANSTQAFVALVSDFVAGRIELRSGDLAAEARRRYSEQAIQPAVLALVESLGA